MIKLLKAQEKTLKNCEWLLKTEQEICFLEIELNPGKDPGNTVEITTVDLKYYISLIW